MTHTTHNKGYSLIELLVYVSIFSLIAVVVINSLVVSTRSFSETKINRTLLHGGFDIMERVSREIRSADSLGSGGVFGTHPGVLVLNGVDALGDPRISRVLLENGVVVLYENDVFQGGLSGNTLEVQQMIFREIAVGSVRAVRIELTVSNTNSVLQKSTTMYTTVLLRGSI